MSLLTLGTIKAGIGESGTVKIDDKLEVKSDLILSDGSVQKRAGKLINSYFVITPATRQTISGTTPVLITGLSITLTPFSVNSKFLIMAIINGNHPHVASSYIYKNGLSILSHTGNSAKSGAQCTTYSGITATSYMYSNQINYMDEPATVAEITYDIRHMSGWAGTASYQNYVNDRDTNDMRTPSTLTILEFAE